MGGNGAEHEPSPKRSKLEPTGAPAAGAGKGDDDPASARCALSDTLALSGAESAVWELLDTVDGNACRTLSMRAPEPSAAGGSEFVADDAPTAPVQLPAALLLPAAGSGPRWALHTLRMSDRGLTTPLLPAAMWGLVTLVALDLSRNRLAELPPAIGGLTALERLDVSRNRLKELRKHLAIACGFWVWSDRWLVFPAKELGSLEALITLEAQSNHLRPAKRSLPLAELGSLPVLRSIDLCVHTQSAVACEYGSILTDCVWSQALQPEAEGSGTAARRGCAAGQGAAGRPASQSRWRR